MSLIDEMDLYPGRHTGSEIDDLLDKVQNGDIIGGSNVNVDTNGNVVLVDNGETYIIQAEKVSAPIVPVVDKPFGNYNKSVSIRISSSAKIYYSLDGTTPDANSPNGNMNVDLVLNEDTNHTYKTYTLKIRSYNEFTQSWSSLVEGVYNVYRKLDPPSISVSGVPQDSARNVSITTNDANVTIYRSIDGGATWQAGGEFGISSSLSAGMLKAQVKRLNWVDSDIATYDEDIILGQPAMYYAIRSTIPSTDISIETGYRINASSFPATFSININNGGILYIAYPSTLGNLTHIIDQNGLDYIDDFNVSTIGVYKMYYMKYSGRHNGMTYQLKNN